MFLFVTPFSHQISSSPHFPLVRNWGMGGVLTDFWLSNVVDARYNAQMPVLCVKTQVDENTDDENSFEDSRRKAIRPSGRAYINGELQSIVCVKKTEIGKWKKRVARDSSLFFCLVSHKWKEPPKEFSHAKKTVSLCKMRIDDLISEALLFVLCHLFQLAQTKTRMFVRKRHLWRRRHNLC